jgi:hypothetical protein
MTLFLFLAACNACESCAPQLPDGPDEPQRQDTSEPPPDTADSAVDTAPEDTGPPARCAVEETEPNDVEEQAGALPMEEWACGTFQRTLDADWFRFTSIEPGWVEITVEAASRGSDANAQVQVVGADGTSTLSMDGYLSTDPRVVFPADAPGTWSIALSESMLDYGDEFTWFAMASIIKQPVLWTFDEAEPNDAVAQAQDFPLGETAFGRIGRAGDLDWYHVRTGEGEDTITFAVEAFAHGSVANTKLVLFAADGTTVLRTDYRGEIDYDPDPFFEQRVTGPTEWYLLVRTEDDRGSPYHWYTLSISSANASN